MTYLALVDIDDPDGIATELCDEEPLPGQINRQVIDAALDIAERDFGFKLQR
jgi:hypothetical protein